MPLDLRWKNPAGRDPDQLYRWGQDTVTELRKGSDSKWPGFLQVGTGAIARTGLSKAREIFSVKDFGAIGDGSTDDTTAVQNAVTAAVANGGVLYLNPGTYKTTVALSVTGALTIFGSGITQSIIQPSTSINAFNITSLSAVVFFDFAINYSALSVGGTSAILLNMTTSSNANSKFERLLFTNAATGITLTATGNGSILYTSIERCTFLSGNFGVTVNNTGNFFAAGDLSFVNNIVNLVSTGGTSVGFQIIGGSGFRIVGNKFLCDNGNNSYGVATFFAASLPTSAADLLIVGNSFENMQYGVLLQRSGTTGNFSNVQVVGNEFECFGDAVFNVTDATGSWVVALVISNNTIFFASSGTINGIQINATTDFQINDNLIYRTSGSNSVTGIIVGSVSANGRIMQNTLINLTTGQFIENASTTTIIDDSNGVAFANLPAQAQNGSRLFVTDGTSPSSPLTGGGTGTTAFRQNGAWKGI